jgi:DNA processing protein
LNEQHYWLGFSLVSAIGPKRIAMLLDAFGNLEMAWNAPESRLKQAGLDGNPLRQLLIARSKIDLAQEMDKVRHAHARLITLADEEYPTLLRTLPDAPPVLYVRGALQAQDNLALAIVGTRKATQYGRDAAHTLAKQLAGNGVTIVSGLAQGIDTAAPKGALDAGGRTIAVLGCGIERVYPASNQQLAKTIIENGALLSEFPIGTPPDGRNFPRRNRVISGLSLGVLIAEAPEKSGALITATTAAEQGREVFAIPGNIFSPPSVGANALIQDGAKLVMNAQDVLNELRIAETNVQTKATTEAVAPTNEIERHLLSHLSAEPIHVDDLVRLSGYPIAHVTSTLTILELKGLAQSAGHMQYCVAR